MAIVLTVRKQKEERFDVSIDFTNKLTDGQAIAGITSKAWERRSKIDAAAILLGSPTFDGAVGVQQCRAGTDLTDYIIQLQITTDKTPEPDVREDEILVKIRDTK